MHKKAQGLSLNTIVIAAIVLIVLVVLVAIVMGAIGNFSDDFDATRKTSCPTQSTKEECDSNEEKILGNFQPRLPPGKVCCLYPCGQENNQESCSEECTEGTSSATSGDDYCGWVDATKPYCCIYST